MRSFSSARTAPFLLALVFAAAAARADHVELDVLTYNIHGLPSWIAGDDPPARIPQLLAKAEGYDVVLLQEDFFHQGVVDAHKRHPHLWRGQRSGLTVLSGFDAVGDAIATPYGVCNGWISAANDCLADKGFLHVRLRLPDGSELDVWNTHLDAGRSDADRDVRASQLAILAAAIETTSAGRAVLVGGDFNLEWDDPADRALLEAFAKRLGLHVAAQTSADGWESHLDYVLVRDGTDVCMAGGGEKDPSFVDAGGEPLSDHPAIRARLFTSGCDE